LRVIRFSVNLLLVVFGTAARMVAAAAAAAADAAVMLTERRSGQQINLLASARAVQSGLPEESGQPSPLHFFG
jgi:uncharacterized membrane protein YczE